MDTAETILALHCELSVNPLMARLLSALLGYKEVQEEGELVSALYERIQAGNLLIRMGL
jgi:hypothetical protein